LLRAILDNYPDTGGSRSTGDLGWHRALAHVEERSKQEFSVGMGAVLRIGPDRIVTLDGCS